MLRLYSLLLLLLAINQSNALDFTLVTAKAPWSARASAFLTRAPNAFTYQSATGATVNAPANSFLIFGSDNFQANDVWVSTNKGSTWSLIAGNGTQYTTFWPSKGAAVTTGPGGRHYRISGERTNGGQCLSTVTSTTNGQVWTSTTDHPWSPRMWASTVVDSTGALYLIGGRSCQTSRTFFDVWRSTNQGNTWTQQVTPDLPLPFGGPRNAVAGAAYNEILRKDILYHWSGWDGNADHNDIWTSSDQGISWQSITVAAPWRKRDDATGFVTSNGVLVLVGGKSVGNPEIFHNDIWVSLNGGYTWGKCIEDAAFSDRRYSTTTLDQDGFLYVAAGESNEGDAGLLNDVWKSTVSFNNVNDLVRECGVKMPVCGKVGLSCYPNVAGTVRVPGGVYCPACGDPNDLDMLNFVQQSSSAPWSARAYANMESFPKTVTYTPVGWNYEITVKKGSLIMQGSGKQDENDVWLSTNHGVDWTLIAGVSRYGRGGLTYAAGGHDTTSFPNNPFAVAYAFDEKYGYMYRLGGEARDGSSGCANTVIASVDGVRWTTSNPSSVAFVKPLRRYAAATVDSIGNVYITGGTECGKATGLNDVWKSDNRGRSWTLQTAKASWPGRLVHVMLESKTTSYLGSKDVMWVMGGWTGSLDYNDVWASTDLGVNWHVITLGATWQRRDDFNAEITKAGLMIVSGGKQANSDGSDREYFNDVWVSANGGYTWSECIKDAAFADRRYQMTVIDDEGYLLVAGGNVIERNTETLFNDVWRSSFSFNDLEKVKKACGLIVPKCGVGLSCLPSSPGFKRLPGDCGVTCTACPTECNAGKLDFLRQSGEAPWSARSSGTMEQINKAITYTNSEGTNVVAPSGSIVMHGEASKEENDVWLSTNKGLTWSLIAGISRKGRSGLARATGGHDVTSFTPTIAPAYTLDSKHNLYRINGENVTNQACADQVWMSSNGGVTWVNQYLDKSSTKRITPPRQYAGAIWDSTGHIYVTGGRTCTNNDGRNDVWRSADQGKNWQLMTANAPWRPRLVHQLLSVPASQTRLNRELLVMMSGWIGQTGEDTNDVWASSDNGKSWHQITAAADWQARDDANAEITANGILVLTSGKTDKPYEIHNDVWVSPDGGYTWGQCIRDAAFSDRRYQMTMFDNDDFLYVAGGDSADGGPLNDVWRSTLQFSDAKVIMSLCNVKKPKCGFGLNCFPNSAGFRILDNGAGATCDLCKSDPMPDPDDDESSSSSSTGASGSSGSAVITTTSLLIIFGVLAAFVVVALLFARQWRNSQAEALKQQQQLSKMGTEMSTGLLGSAQTV